MNRILKTVLLIILLININILKVYADEINSITDGIILNEELQNENLEQLKEIIKKISYDDSYREFELTGSGIVCSFKTNLIKVEENNSISFQIGGENGVALNNIDMNFYNNLVEAFGDLREDSKEIWIEGKYEVKNGQLSADANEPPKQIYYFVIAKIIYDDPNYNPDNAWPGAREISENRDNIENDLSEGARNIENTARDIRNAISDFPGFVAEKIRKYSIDLVRVYADALQMLLGSIKTITDEDYNEWKLTFSYSALNLDNELNKYTNVSNEEGEDEIQIEEKGFNKDTKIPLILVDIYNMSIGDVEAFSVNFFRPGKNIVKKIINNLVRASLYLSVALLITSLIWNGIQLSWGTLTPRRRQELLAGLQNALVSSAILVGTIVIMAICMFASDMFLEDLRVNDSKELPIRVHVKNAGYSFSTNVIGYARYMTEIKDDTSTKTFYTYIYWFLVLLNVLLSYIMIRRMLRMIGLSIIGPVIAALHVFNFDRNIRFNYRDWLETYIVLSSIQVLMAFAYRYILHVSVYK